MANRIPDIPVDKTHHIFVCHKKNSLDVVRKIVDNLEKEKVICYYCDRDSIAGVRKVENIHEAIRKSLYMLIVLSEGFENSPFRNYELMEASHLMVQGKYKLIPIRIEPCSIPKHLQHHVCMYVEDCIDTAHVKIMDAMNKQEMLADSKQVDETSPRGPYTFPVTYLNITVKLLINTAETKIRKTNGESKQFKLKPYRPSILSFKRYRLKFEERETAELWNNEYEVSADILKEIENTVNDSLLIKYQHIWDHPYATILVVFMHILLLLTIFFLVLFFTTSGKEKAQSFQPIGYALAIGLPLWFLSLVVILGVHMYYEDNYSVYAKNRFARFIDKRDFLQKYRMEDETNEDCTSRLFDEFLSRNCKQLRIPSNERLHPMTNNAKCVCSLVEDWLKTKPLSSQYYNKNK